MLLHKFSKLSLSWAKWALLLSTQTAPEEDVPAAVTGHGAADLLQPDADSWRLLPNRQPCSGPSGVTKLLSGPPHVSRPPASAARQSSGLASIQPPTQPESFDGTGRGPALWSLHEPPPLHPTPAPWISPPPPAPASWSLCQQPGLQLPCRLWAADPGTFHRGSPPRAVRVHAGPQLAAPACSGRGWGQSYGRGFGWSGAVRWSGSAWSAELPPWQWDDGDCGLPAWLRTGQLKPAEGG